MSPLRVSVSRTSAAQRLLPQLLSFLDQHRFGQVEVDADEMPVGELEVGRLMLLPVSSLLSLEHDSLVSAVPRRSPPQDVLVYAAEHGDRLARRFAEEPSRYDPSDLFADVPPGARLALVGKGEAALACWLRPDVLCEAVGDEVQSAFARLRSGSLDVLIAAVSELDGELLDASPHRLLRDPWITAPGQGGWMVVCSTADEELKPLLLALEHRNSRLEIEAEMQLQVLFSDDAGKVLRARAQREGDRLLLTAALLAADAEWAVRAHRRGEATRVGAARLARGLARDLRDQLQRRGVNATA